MRRLFFVLCVIVAASLSAASARDATASNTGAIQGTVTYWNTYGNGNSAEAKALTTKVIPAFQKAYPGVHVKNLSVPYDGFFTKLLTAIAGGTAPDLVRSDLIWVPQLANLKALVPLDRRPWFTRYARAVFPGTLKTNYYRGHYYGLPLDTNTRVLIYNKAVFQQAGIAGPPTTTTQFLQDCAKIKALGRNLYCYAEGGTGAWNVLPWIWSFGGNITDSRYRKAQGYLNNSHSVAALQFLVDLKNKGYMSPSILGGGISTSDCMGKNQCGMILDGPWMVPIFASSYPDLKFGMSLVPRGSSTSHSVVGGEDIVMLNQSKNRAAAEAFLRFLLSSRAQVDMGQVGQMPVLKSLGSSQLPSYYKIFQRQLKTAKPRTPSPHFSAIDDAVSTAVQHALRGDSSPKKALDEAARTVNALLH